MTGQYHLILLGFLDPATFTGALIDALIFAAFGVAASRLVRVLARRAEAVFPNPTAGTFLGQLLQVVVVLVVFILYAGLVPALRSVGTALLAGASVVSIVLGLAAQSTLGNLVAGLSLLLYHPFKVGDELQVSTPRGLMTGTITSVTLGYTILVAPTAEEIIVPNSVMASAVMIRTAAPGGSA
jgi:small-conductance mechanosensitive channel